MHDCIQIRGAREHNLKNIDVSIPRDKLVVITGLSGSGKSSLAFDTIYAEGQRRYVESLSAYARQFLGQMDKPDLDSIDGLSPAVSIDQKTTSKNPRSTVGTVTEIYDYLRLLFARVGVPHCPECGREIKRQTTDQVVDKILAVADGKRALVLAPIVSGRKGEHSKLLEDLRKEGFARVRVDGEVLRLADDIVLDKKYKHNIDVVVDRIVLKAEATARLSEAVETATRLAEGSVVVRLVDEQGASEAPQEAGAPSTPTAPQAAAASSAAGATAAGAQGGLAGPAREESFSLALACPQHGHSLDELEPRDFSFNAPYGACPECLGLGYKNEVDPSLVIPDPSLSLADGAYAVVSSTSNYLPQILSAVARHLGVSTTVPWEEYAPDVRDAFLNGLGDTKVRIDYVTRDGRDTHWSIKWEGLLEFTMQRYRDTQSEMSRQKLEEFLAITPCKACNGARLKPGILAVTVGGRNIYEVTQLSARRSLEFFEQLEGCLDERERQIGSRIIKEILERLRFLVDVGLDYLTLERATASLSGGEAQRIRLATQIGAGLMGVLYILDEPSIGLHQRDNERLIATLERLRDLGNTVIVVEHDEETIRSADHIIDIGPGAGEMGGRIVAEGSLDDVLKSPDSLTADYLSGRCVVPLPAERRVPGLGSLTISGVSENNLKDIDVAIPFGTLTVITGVSGSGKSSLVTDTLAPALTNRVHHSHKRVGSYRKLEGIERIDKVIDIDQSPIGRTPRSNPATYVGLWDDIRSLFSSMPESRVRGYAPGRFSFNVSGGRCEACKGDGQIKIEMHFLPDIYVPCEVCHGARYNRETLQVAYRGKNVSDLLNMSVEEALGFFENIPQLARKLQTLHDVGLGYIKLGQPATTLSGGEAQRVKLASELQRKQTGKTFYILDEPTTGLHFDDVRQLLEVLQRLVDRGNTVLVIEHNLDIIKSADYLIDLGPEGGDRGGEVIACGTPEEVARVVTSHTGRFLAQVLPLS
ncbi:MAG: excinuclease ABC subunit UvrA [Coriobacteriales bacterium]|jgi:excinuclease ABC subunit A|nr:excinuclease ABC subunit UvrA [Coriobacteriales bacterium]